MRRFGKVLGQVLTVCILAILAVWLLAPKEPIDRHISFDSNALGDDIDSYLQTEELHFSDIRPEVHKRIIWAGAAGAQTPLSVIYIHGFSASSEEIRPVPDLVAQALGANLFFTRLAGHGRSGDALGQVTAGDWVEDMAEAMAIGRRLGGRVLVISTSTGATLAALAATDPDLSQGMAGVVMVSPNFRLRSAVAGAVLDAPLARWWGPWVAGERRRFTPLSDRQAAYWTTEYPTRALFPMAALMHEARAADHSAATMPALFLYSDADQVIDPAAIAPVRDGWGGPVTEVRRVMGKGDDPASHVIAGDAMSPGQTAQTAEIILIWAKGL
ncbi:MAG: alpha/beta hydrolase [Rhodobacteraceae bacterium]|nr:alpha/beta hydrolase [Paracoccaceae bacterium]